MMGIDILTGHASAEQVAEHLTLCDSSFIPPLSDRVNITDYARKVTTFALCIEGWHNGSLIGLICMYCDDFEKGAFITNVSVIPAFRGKGVANLLMSHAIEKVREKGISKINLEVDNTNEPAQCLYRRFGFSPNVVTQQTTMMLINV